MITKPKGTIDIKNSDALLYEYVNSVVATMMNAYNYEYIRTPLFEAVNYFIIVLELHLTL